MKDKERIVLLQKQLSIAVKVLRTIRDEGFSSDDIDKAEEALDEIERIRLVQEGRWD